LNKLLAFLERLERDHLWYRLEHVRPDTVMVVVRVPGEVWEVEFFEDGQIEFERFRSSGGISDEADLEEALHAQEVADR
jgi:hypothetical protein